MTMAPQRTNQAQFNDQHTATLHAEKRHNSACRMLGFALVSGDPETWVKAAFVFDKRLNRIEIASLALLFLCLLNADDFAEVLSKLQSTSL